MKERKNKIIIGETKENKNYEEVVKMNKERELIKEVKENKEVEVKKNSENRKGGDKMKESKELVEEIEAKRNSENRKGGDKMKESKELVEEIEAKRSSESEKGGDKMDKGVKELVSKVEERKRLLVETVVKWAQGLCPIKSLHVKIKGRYYPLLEKQTGKLSVIDKVLNKKLPFNSLDKNMKFVIVSILAERKEEIEKEVEKDKRKYLEGKIEEIDELLKKF